MVWSSIESKIKSLRYAKVIMQLSALLEGEFFNTYIKTGIYFFIFLCFLFSCLCFCKTVILTSGLGDVLMISEGRSGVDDVFSLHNGV